MSSLLRLRDVTRFYGSRLVFANITLEVRAGGVLLLAGPNGAGKSTLLKIMAGLIRPSSGDVLAAPGTGPDKELRIGYLGHQTFLYPELTARENLRFWARLSLLSLPERAFDDMLERVGLNAFAEEKTKGFSRGMAQRLNLARVFLMQPDLLLLDEPGTGLDARSTGILYREITRARQDGAGIVWISHHLADDMQRADAVALLEARTLAFHGTVDAFLARQNSAEHNGCRERDAVPGGAPC